MARVVGNQKLARITNQRLIVDEIREKGSLSRADLSKLLRISLPTVSWNVASLIDQGLIVETGSGESSGGRRPIMLEFNYGCGSIIGIDLSGETLRIALCDLKPAILDEDRFEVPSFSQDHQIIRWIMEKIDELLERNPLSKKHLTAISIGFPGVVDTKTGRVLASSRFCGWIGLDLKKEFTDRYKAFFLINNDINAAVLGELALGCGNGYKNLVYIGVDVGIGAGLVLNGALYEGSGHNAGELSKMILSPSFYEGVNRQEIYLESMLSTTRMITDIHQIISENETQDRSMMTIKGEKGKIGLEDIAKALQRGDVGCMEWVGGYARKLGIVIANIVNLLDVEAVIIGNEVTKLGPAYLDAIRDTVNDHVTTNPRILFSELGTKTVLYGTFAIACDHVFQNLIH